VCGAVYPKPHADGCENAGDDQGEAVCECCGGTVIPGHYCCACGKIAPSATSTPTIYELDGQGLAFHAHHYCSGHCRQVALATFIGASIDAVNEPNADIADGEVCDTCGKVL
jgi:hypothetical protein